MVKRNSTNVRSVVEDMPSDYTVSTIKDDALVIEDAPVYNEPEQMVSVRSRYPAHLIYTGQETGQRYEWKKPGDVVSVSAKDAPSLLAKVLGSGVCCGGGTRNSLFELA